MVDKPDTQVLQSKAWENLMERVDYLNQFAGNRSENAKLTKMVKEAMDKAKEQVTGMRILKLSPEAPVPKEEKPAYFSIDECAKIPESAYRDMVMKVNHKIVKRAKK